MGFEEDEVVKSGTVSPPVFDELEASFKAARRGGILVPSGFPRDKHVLTDGSEMAPLLLIVCRGTLENDEIALDMGRDGVGREYIEHNVQERKRFWMLSVFSRLARGPMAARVMGEEKMD
jgi:hypothetical protein